MDQLLDHGHTDLVLNMLKYFSPAEVSAIAGRIDKARLQQATLLFQRGRYREAIDTLIDIHAEPSTVLSLYPEGLCDDGSLEKGPEKTAGAGAAAPRVRKTESIDSLASHASIRGALSTYSSRESISSFSRLSVREGKKGARGCRRLTGLFRGTLVQTSH